ncbi:hypothetical protein SODALDRAFT_321863 [Sodiomyces alkalinus F11]|uniref:Uncharacterized protein n=1 Tax=Sodiomyces alkalinus (strain CBS 110278 / VKM F-3762 / F11) TaxID=1314773 RepID=A0A3N2Q198_SODAK|nr:hypothetical protein SODALDRAFT_321863 [Sodiomyces alkalinus F11]ROT40534.1 hypothetical protein SODALDRAFT_321863 [Sodiomyces alkalinus F11]
MKFFTVVLSALAATFVTAAPAAVVEETSATALSTIEARTTFDLSRLNGLQGFQNVDLNYLLRLNQVNLNLFQQLGQAQNLNLLAFSHLFNAQAFDVQSLLQLQQLHTVLAFHQQGLFNNLNLANLHLGGLNLGLIQNVHGINLDQFVDRNVIGRVQLIANQPTHFVVPHRQ